MWMMEMKKKRVEDERVSIAVGGCGWKEKRQVVAVGQPPKLGLVRLSSSHSFKLHIIGLSSNP